MSFAVNRRRTEARRPSKRRPIRAAVLASVAAAAIAALGWPAPRGIAATPVPLVIYAALGYDSVVTKAFQAATGVPVALVEDSTGPLLVKVQAERNNPKWGVLWVDGDEPFAALDQQHMLIRGYQPNAPYNPIGQSLIPANRSYIPTGVTMAGTVVYNRTTVSTPPTAWADLLSPAWKGAVGMNNPSISGPTFPFVAGLFNFFGGVPEGQKFLMALKANGLKVYNKNPDTLHALQAGDIRLAMIQSSAGIGATTKSADIKVAFIRPTTPIPSVMGIDALVSPEEIAEAKQFAEFVLSPAGQDLMKTGDPTGDSLYWPVVEGVTPLPALPALTSVPAKAIDPYKWGAMEDSINSWFVNNIVQ